MSRLTSRLCFSTVISRRCGDDSLAGMTSLLMLIAAPWSYCCQALPPSFHLVCNGYQGYVKLSLHTAKVYVNFETRQEHEIKILFMFKQQQITYKQWLPPLC